MLKNIIAVCAKIAYGNIRFAAAAGMFIAALNFRIAEGRKDNLEQEPEKQSTWAHLRY